MYLGARLTLMKAREVNRRIEELGGYELRTRGSHRRYKATKKLEDGTVVTASTTVAQHSGDIPIGTQRSIEKAMKPVFGEGWLT
jgi:predicted RNA binding protein YcfA (HicA-like mRNA interferase family)